ncbi:hypothetical protein MSNKSG1_06313 [Marinobacter santoriniensis NKSG1]|uniref:tRNA 2-thiouridine synthesizing protein B n=1 Tax=Marinobacter santoriniensis NKSG1 TaxID=1288826 RepID=M7DCS8_9GAMM|nr:sulfurtransferase complex subunit TusB [Marinobacter santoriniensis]EMP55462.1 hypothetical protein MSNKSG1_06313 [Marinobacter santoriniensis NKSG1]
MASIHTLHILNKSPDHPRFQRCLTALGPEDALMLIENGVLATTTAGRLATVSGQIYALSPDLEARGLQVDDSTFVPVDYEGMVRLTTEAGQVISW